MAVAHESSGLSSSFTDLMTSLAVIFILLLVAMLNNARQQTEDTKSRVLERLEHVLNIFQKQGVQVRADPKDPLGLLVVVPEGLLRFEQGKADIPLAGRQFVGEFIPLFVETACSPELREGISSVVVEGHASSEGDEKLNLRLSQARSMSVVQQSLESLDSSPLEKGSDFHHCFVELVSATGRGSAEPIEIDGTEDKSLSRRVVFKIRVKSLEQREFENKLDLNNVEQND